MNILTGNKNFINTFIHETKKLRNSIKSKDFLVLFSGGNTPKIFSKDLIEAIDNEHKDVIYSLTDERLVPMDSNLSNSQIFRDSQSFNFKSLCKRNGLLDKDNIDFISNIKPSISIVGFGLDGHTLSIFNHKEVPQKYLITKKTDENFERVSFTIKYILQSELIFLLANDKNKMNFLKKTIIEGIASPIGYLADCAQKNNKLFIVTGLKDNIKNV